MLPPVLMGFLNFKQTRIMNEMTNVSMKLSGKTIERVERIKAITQEKNRTRIMATGVEVLELLINEMNHGSKIVIEKKNGNREKLNIVGL